MNQPQRPPSQHDSVTVWHLGHSMWARTNIVASVVPQYLQRGGSAFSGAFFSDIETNEKPIPIRRQAVPDRPRRHIQKQMKFRFELTNS